MKNIFGPFAGVMLLSAAPAIAQTNAAPASAQPAAAAEGADPAKLAEAHAIMDVILPPGRREGMLDKLQSDIFAQMMPTRADWMQEPGVKKIVDDFITEAKAKQRAVYAKHLPEQVDAMASAYAHRFSLAELKDIDAFAHSPSGRHYFSESLAIVGDPAVAKVNAAAIADIRSVTEALLPDFKDKLVTYVKAHPDLAAKIAAEAKTQ
jgi:hypothetical protein